VALHRRRFLVGESGRLREQGRSRLRAFADGQDDGDRRAHLDRDSHVDQGFAHHAVLLGGQIDDGLVGLDLGEDVTLCDVVPFGLAPFLDDRVGGVGRDRRHEY